MLPLEQPSARGGYHDRETFRLLQRLDPHHPEVKRVCQPIRRGEDHTRWLKQKSGFFICFENSPGFTFTGVLWHSWYCFVIIQYPVFPVTYWRWVYTVWNLYHNELYLIQKQKFRFWQICSPHDSSWTTTQCCRFWEIFDYRIIDNRWEHQ